MATPISAHDSAAATARSDPKLPVRAVGCDRVEIVGGDRIVVAKRELSDWVAAKYRPTAVEYEGVRYFVAEVTPKGKGLAAPERGRGWRYRLVPWPSDRTDLPGREIRYDASLVERREEEFGRAVKLGSLIVPLVPLYPLLGLLPSGVKASLEQHFAIASITTTRWSLRLEYLIGLVFAAAIVPGLIFQFPIGLGPMWLPPIVCLIALGDAAMRYAQTTEPTSLQYGAFEWLFHRL